MNSIGLVKILACNLRLAGKKNRRASADPSDSISRHPISVLVTLLACVSNQISGCFEVTAEKGCEKANIMDFIMDFPFEDTKGKRSVLYTLSRRVFALSLLQAAAFRCYQERETAYKAVCVCVWPDLNLRASL